MKTFLVLLAATLGLSACTIVGPGERGVRYNLGKVSEEVMEPGTHLWIPFFSGSYTFDVSIIGVQVKTNAGTKDQQEVNTKAVVNLQIDPTKVVKITKEFGSESALFDALAPILKDSVNATVSKYSAEEVLTKRPQLSKDIETLVKERISDYGVFVHNVSIEDMQYSEEYSQAIERKQIAEQKAKQAEYETQQAEQNAKAAVAKARGEAEANRLKQQTITPALTQYEAVLKWNGQLPQVMGSGATPFINLKMMSQEKN